MFGSTPHGWARVRVWFLALGTLILSTARVVAGGVPPERAALFDYDATRPLDLKERAVRRQGAVEEHDVSFASPKGGRVTAFLLVPRGKGPFAGILFLHGATGTRRSLLPGARMLCEAGAVCLLIDAPLRGGRAVPGKRLDDFAHPEEMRDAIIQAVVDLRRGVDLLLSRPDVDPKRIAFVGSSLGGSVGGILAGVERRIAAYALLEASGNWMEAFRKSTFLLVRLARATMSRRQMERAARVLGPIDPVHFVAHAAPAALLFQNGTGDTIVPAECAQAFQDAGSQPKVCKWYDAGHELNIDAFVDRAEWLREKIGIGPVPRPQSNKGLNH
ncbi:MAG: alpha/beta fold hydrolase [Armatimonadota bacterium]|nr:alpha/beta fold hydrolase [Armatimonadota bacterium]